MQPSWSETRHKAFPRTDYTTADVARMLRVAPALKCPGTNPGCGCVDCVDRPVVLRVQTFTSPTAPDVLAPACDGSLTCLCEACEQDRARRVRLGVRETRQPWQPLRRAA